jgi:hypothetical protein
MSNRVNRVAFEIDEMHGTAENAVSGEDPPITIDNHRWVLLGNVFISGKAVLVGKHRSEHRAPNPESDESQIPQRNF